MKKRNHYIGLILMSAMLFASCVKESQIELDFDPELVVFSNISPVSISELLYEDYSLTVSTTKKPNDNTTFKRVNNASIAVNKVKSRSASTHYNNDQRCDCFSPEDGDFKFEVGYDYELTVNVPGFEELRAQTSIPAASKILGERATDFKMVYSDRDDGKVNISYFLNFLVDLENDQEYYHVLFHNVNEFSSFGGNSVSLLPVEPIYTDQFNYVKHSHQGILMTKSDIEDKGRLKMKFSDYVSPGNYKVTHYVIELRSVTEEYYKYHESLSRQRLVHQDPFAEPVTIYSNVKNGYGNFAGYNTDVSFIPFEN